jgi:Spy/CpxP family protein refolding chaperone
MSNYQKIRFINKKEVNMKMKIMLSTIALLVFTFSSSFLAQNIPLPDKTPVAVSSNYKDIDNDLLTPDPSFDYPECTSPYQFENGEQFRGKGFIEKLKLTPDQEKKFDDLRTQHQKDAVDFRAKIQKNRIDLHKIIKQGNIDEKKILDLTDENSKLQADMKRAGIKHWIDVYKMLNQDQQEIWVKALAKIGNPQMIKERMRDRVKNFMMDRRRNGDFRKLRGW